MAITTRYAVNMAMQYNEVTLNDFLINPSVGSRRFLTEAEQTRILRATETSALYFLTDVTGAGRSARYRWYDSGGTLLNEYLLGLTSAGVHNSIPIDWTSFYVPSGATKLTVAIIGSANGFSNGQFTLGSGNLFTSWTLTQPSRTNLLLRSQEFDVSPWQIQAGGTGVLPVITANFTTAPDGTLTADKIVFNTGAGVTAGDQATTYQLYTVGAGTYNGSIYFKGATGGEQILFRHTSGGNFTLYTLTTEWQRFDTTEVYVVGFMEFGLRQGVVGTINSSATIYVWGAQLEQSSYATPYIPTTSAPVTTSVGEFIQDATGGEDGTRCIRMWASNAGSTLLNQATNLVTGQNYTIRFRAKADAVDGSDVINIVAGATDVGDTPITTDWAWYSITFTAIATASTSIYFSYVNDTIYGFVSLDDVSISLTTPSELSEVRTYLLDDECVKYEYQLNWLNKLGGRDTWVFTGYPTTTKDVVRDGNLEYSRRTNLTAPKRIYGTRSVQSRESITLTHQCKTRATAEWIKSELIDTLDVLIKFGSAYYPADIVASSIVVSNTFSQDYTIRFTLRYAFDVNVQTR